MKLLKKIPLFLSFFLLFSCDEFPITEADNAAGLKSALEFGSKYALNSLGSKDGFYLDMAVKIGLPQDAADLVKAGKGIPFLGDAIDKIEKELILALNRAAEASIEGVIPIVVNSIKEMTIQDATSILFSSNQTAATNYLHGKTYEPLTGVCYSVIDETLSRNIVGSSAQDLWKRLTGYYNDVAFLVPTLKPIETDLALYTTQKALDGVFLKISDEEVKIRTDVSARVTDLLRKVFGQLDKP